MTSAYWNLTTQPISISSIARPVMADMPLELWLLDLSGPPPAAPLAWLSLEEQARAARFHFTRHRERYQRAHIGMRLVLEKYCDIRAPWQTFDIGLNGKPCLTGAPGLHFSLSYAGDLALMAVDCDAPVGVDIECDRMIPEADDLGALHFHPLERQALARQTMASRHGRGFLLGWTRKEACLKAIGCGLSMPAAEFHSGFNGRQSVTVSGQSPLEVGECPPIPGFTAAWARAAALA